MVMGNILTNIGVNQESSNVVALAIGRDEASDEPVSRAQGNGIIAGNIIEDVVSNQLASTGFISNGIQCFGSYVEITGNHIKRVSNTNTDATDQEGIYWKGFGFRIHHNFLVDAGGNEGAIRGKGTEAIMGGRNYIHENDIEFSPTAGDFKLIAISLTYGNCIIHDNKIRGAVYQGIVTLDAVDAVIRDNEVGIRAGTFTAIYGILVENPIKSRVIGNTVECDGSDDGNMFMIMTNFTKSMGSTMVEMSGNTFTIVNENAAATGSYRACSYDAAAHDVTLDVLKTCDNTFLLRDTLRLVVCIRLKLSGGTSAVNLASIQGNIMAAVGTDIEQEITITELVYENNPGFTTVLP